MINEIVFLSTALIDLALILLTLRLGVAGLTGMLVANVILVSTFGAKLVSLFGHVTNAGNVFYACTFFASMMIVEHYGAKKAYKSVLVGFLALILFVIMAEFTIRSGHGATSTSVDTAMNTLFTTVPRVALGSMTAYIIAQNVNIYVFDKFKKKTKSKLVSLRIMAGSISGQLLDSVIFFSIAFAGILPLNLLVQTMLTGFVVKVAVGLLSVPFLKISYTLKPLTKINYRRRVS